MQCFLRNKKVATFCILFFFAGLLPSLSTVVLHVSETPLALRYLYLPSIGFSILCGYLLGADTSSFRWNSRLSQKLKPLAFCAVFLLYYAGCSRQIAVWHDEISLWTDTIKKSPFDGLPHGELCKAYIQRLEFKKAITECNAALDARYDAEGKSIVSNNLGYMYFKLGELDEAKAWYEKALLYRENYAIPNFNLGYVFVLKEEGLAQQSPGQELEERKRLLEEAVVFFDKAIRINPYYYKAYYLAGFSYSKLGNPDMAKKYYLDLIKLDSQGEWAQKALEALKQLRKE
jgi:tetratricopeptide (TPR) repeat protein